METMTAIRKNLTVATFDVFEKMFYLFLETTTAESRRDDIVASLSFSGPFEGEIRLYLPNSVALAMVENMLNLREAEITTPIVEDCVKEAVNMIGGQFLRTLDPTNVFHLSLPICAANTSAARQADPGWDHHQWLHFESERGALSLSARLKASGDRATADGRCTRGFK
jgi:CheY-specific phosphatase CheX